MDDASAARRATVIGNYEQGKITSADKRKADLSNEQSGTLGRDVSNKESRMSKRPEDGSGIRRRAA